jgi:predicted  nucleic acid-binding Zn-ribbon protein
VTDIVKRLRMECEPTDGDMETAADRIESLEAEVERLRAALAEIRDADANLGPMHDWADEKFEAVRQIAREALEGSEP